LHGAVFVQDSLCDQWLPAKKDLAKQIYQKHCLDTELFFCSLLFCNLFLDASDIVTTMSFALLHLFKTLAMFQHIVKTIAMFKAIANFLSKVSLQFMKFVAKTLDTKYTTNDITGANDNVQLKPCRLRKSMCY
jgi:hypothetical protein